MADNDNTTCDTCGGSGDYWYGAGALNPDGHCKPCPDCGGTGSN